MSLHVLADHMASKGRNGDSMLVHMTPGEVAGLHALAAKHGGELTINPDTGLPEANFLKSLLPMIAGFALGPAGFGLVSSGLAAGAVVGGVTGLATGSLSKGLMAGLGAYGGFGIGESLAGLGAGELAQGQISANMPTLAEGASQTQIADYAKQVNDLRTAGLQSASQLPMADKLSAGFSSASASPMDALNFAKDNFKPLAAAAGPIMADMMVPTTTKMPDAQNPGYIRQKVFDPGSQTYRDLAPVKANEFKDRSFSDIYRGYNTGGIVALAGGGVSDTDIFNYFKTPGLSDAQIAADMQKFKVSAADIARATGTQGQQADYEKRFVNTLVAPTTDASEFQKATGAVGLKDQSLATAMQNAGLSQGAQYALTQPAQNDTGFTGGIIDASTGKPVDLYNQIGYTAGALPGDQAGLEGLYGNINYVTSGLQNLINTGKMSVTDAQNAALAELARTKVSVGDVKAATGKDFGNLFTPKKVDEIVTKGPGSVTNTVLDTNSTTNAPIGTTNPYGNVNNPGDLTFNVDGTNTVQPNIPGRPYGGFSGMSEVKNAYTQGGGSLGYTPYAPKTAAEHDELYNRFTPGGDSEAAYNYLMGKGGAKYPTKSTAGEIMRPYREATLGYPASTNKPYNYDAATGKMVRNPDYVAPGRDAAGNVNYSMSLNEMKKYLTANPLSGQALYDWAQSNGASAQDVADATGRKLSEVYAEFRDASKKAAAAKKTDTTNTDAIISNTNDGGGGGGEAAGGLQTSYAMGGYAVGGGLGSLGSYSDGGRLLKGPGDGVSDSIPATIGEKQQPARLADGEFVVPARIVSELGNGSTEAGAKKLYAMMDRVQKARGKTTGKNKVAANSRADKYLPA